VPSPTNADFWDLRYIAGRTPWDTGGTPPALTRWLASHPGEGARVLIPACGSGHEIVAFTRAGYRVTAIDFSPAAVARARANAGPELAPSIVAADFFTHPFGNDRFNLIYERTFLCALPPDQWPRIVARERELLAPAGVIAGIFFFGEKDDGPPFGLVEDELEPLFSAAFALAVDRPIPASESLPIFAGRERWLEWRRSPSTR
jgi:SAM-dependent methyltransferase